jgi:tight adherence protein B
MIINNNDLGLIIESIDMFSIELMFLFFIVFPILLGFLLYFIYDIYKDYNKKNMMIKTLSDSSNDILDKDKKKKNQNNKIENNGKIKIKLNHSGFISEYSVYVFYFTSISFGFLVAIFLFMVMHSFVASIISFFIFMFFPYLILNKIISNRQEEFNLGLKNVIDKVTSMMRSGVGFEQAFKKSILTTKSKITKEILEIYIKEKEILGEEKCFEKMFKLVESKELRIFYLVISIGRESGGKFSNTLDTLRETLQQQGVIKKEIVSSTKEIKIGTYMIIALTIGIYFLMNKVFNGALNQHFFGSSEGRLQMFFIIIWVSFGLFVNNLMTKIKN